MHIEVSTGNNIEGSQAFTDHIKGLVEGNLSYLDEHITRIEVHLSDASTGNVGETHMHCTLEARLKGQQPTVVKEEAETLEKATKGAATKMKHALESTLGKLSERR